MMAASLPEDGMALFAAGDANLQFARPRDGEAEAVALCRELSSRRAAIQLDYAGPSCCGRGRALPSTSRRSPPTVPGVGTFKFNGCLAFRTTDAC